MNCKHHHEVLTIFSTFAMLCRSQVVRSQHHGGDYDAAGMTLLQLKQHRWLARPNLHDDLQGCAIQALKQQTTKQVVVRFDRCATCSVHNQLSITPSLYSGELKKLPLAALQLAPTAESPPPPLEPGTVSSEPSPKRSPMQSQWIGTQGKLDSNHCLEDAQASCSVFARPSQPTTHVS